MLKNTPPNEHYHFYIFDHCHLINGECILFDKDRAVTPGVLFEVARIIVETDIAINFSLFLSCDRIIYCHIIGKKELKVNFTIAENQYFYCKASTLDKTLTNKVRVSLCGIRTDSTHHLNNPPPSRPMRG